MAPNEPEMFSKYHAFTIEYLWGSNERVNKNNKTNFSQVVQWTIKMSKGDDKWLQFYEGRDKKQSKLVVICQLKWQINYRTNDNFVLNLLIRVRLSVHVHLSLRVHKLVYGCRCPVIGLCLFPRAFVFLRLHSFNSV